eukprot:scaffold570_cov382-Prasinococcus_capsulatus_cf.AAC.10
MAAGTGQGWGGCRGFRAVLRRQYPARHSVPPIKESGFADVADIQVGVALKGGRAELTRSRSYHDHQSLTIDIGVTGLHSFPPATRTAY